MISERVKRFPAIRDLNIHDISLIDALPVYGIKKEILNVGCGPGRIDYHLKNMGWKIYATDLEEYPQWGELRKHGIQFTKSDIFNISSFPVSGCEIVMCNHVIEHIEDWRLAFKNLINLTKTRLIMSFPYKTSFNDPDHCNYWDDEKNGNFLDVKEFINLAKPYAVSLSKERTKPQDKGTNKYEYLLIVDKRQKYN